MWHVVLLPLKSNTKWIGHGKVEKHPSASWFIVWYQRWRPSIHAMWIRQSHRKNTVKLKEVFLLYNPNCACIYYILLIVVCQPSWYTAAQNTSWERKNMVATKAKAKKKESKEHIIHINITYQQIWVISFERFEIIAKCGVHHQKNRHNHDFLTISNDT